MKLLIAIFIAIAPWLCFILGGYLVWWLAHFVYELSFADAMILSGLSWLITDMLKRDAKAEGIL